jgi:hypothetical protein
LNFSVEDILRFTSLAPIFLLLFQKGKKESVKWVYSFFGLFIFTHAILSFLIYLYWGDTARLYFNILFIPVEFIIISYFFFQALNYEVHKKIVIWLSAAFIIALLLKSIQDSGQVFDSVLNGIESLLVIFYSLLYFYEQLRYPKSLFIYSQPVFWGVSGFFLFFTTSFFVFIYRQTLWSDKDFIVQYFYIHALAGILRNLLLTTGIIIKPEKTPLPELST